MEMCFFFKWWITQESGKPQSECWTRRQHYADFITAELQTSSPINIITNTVDTNTGSFIAAPVGVMCR